MLLYLLFAPLVLVLLASRVTPARKVLLTFMLFLGGYAYVMFREATKNVGERRKKRAFLEKVGSGSIQRQQSGSRGSSGYSSGYDSPRKPDRQYSGSPQASPGPSRRQSSAGTQMPPMIRAPSAPLEFKNSPTNQQMKQSRQQSSRW